MLEIEQWLIKERLLLIATADEALSMGNAEYVPQFNMMKDAVKLAKAANLNVTIDKISGKYKITTQNGDLIKSL